MDKAKVFFIVFGVWFALTAVGLLFDSTSSNVYGDEQISETSGLTTDVNVNAGTGWWNWGKLAVKALTSDYSWVQSGSQLAFFRPFLWCMNAAFVIAIAYIIRSIVLGG